MPVRVVLLFVAALSAGCNAEPTGPALPPFKATADTAQLMEWIVDPAADVIWDSVGTIIDMSGRQDFRPETEEEWNAVRNAGALIAESANLLMMAPRSTDRGDDWMEYSQGLADAGVLAIKAAEARDPEAVFDAGGRIYAVCAACHQMYVEEEPGTVLPR